MFHFFYFFERSVPKLPLVHGFQLAFEHGVVLKRLELLRSAGLVGVGAFLAVDDYFREVEGGSDILRLLRFQKLFLNLWVEILILVIFQGALNFLGFEGLLR